AAAQRSDRAGRCRARRGRRLAPRDAARDLRALARRVRSALRRARRRPRPWARARLRLPPRSRVEDLPNGTTGRAALRSQAAIAAQRDALLNGAAVAWIGERVAERSWPALAGARVQFVIAETGQHARPAPGVADHELVLPLPGLDERRALWLRMVHEAERWRV